MLRWTCALVIAVAVIAAPTTARADDAFTFGGAEIELSGEWHLFVTFDLESPPRQARVPIEFRFTQRVVYDRVLAPGRSEPVLSRRVVAPNAAPLIVKLDVEFPADGKKFAASTRFDFGVGRKLGFEAGEYLMEVCSSDGTCMAPPATVVLQGDNPVRTAVDPKDAGLAPPRDAAAVTPAAAVRDPALPGAVTRKPGGCACEVSGARGRDDSALALPILGALALVRRRMRDRSGARHATPKVDKVDTVPPRQRLTRLTPSPPVKG